MSVVLSQKRIGKRITELRKRKGYSQEVLAKRVNISRPSLAQIELGNRSVDILEFQKLSFILEFSLDDFMSKEFLAMKKGAIEEGVTPRKSQERHSIPTLQIRKYKNVLLYILEHCGGKPNVGETVLYKLLYFSDFNYYELYEEHLTGSCYRKLPFGPVPEHFDTYIQKMVKQGELQRIETEYNGYPQTRYLPLVKADLTELRASEKEVIDKVIEQMSDWSATAISNYAHQDMPWVASKEGEVIDYELAFYRGVPFSVRNYGDEMELP